MDRKEKALVEQLETEIDLEAYLARRAPRVLLAAGVEVASKEYGGRAII